jgi:predicted nucleic acid-binding Zn finger protein
MRIKLVCPEKEGISIKTREKAKSLINSVSLEYVSQRNIFFLVKSKENHSVVYSALKEKWFCDCKYFALHNKPCSHILAVNYKLKQLALYR